MTSDIPTWVADGPPLVDARPTAITVFAGYGPAMTEADRIQAAVDEELRRVLAALRPRVTTNGLVGSATFQPEVEHRGAPGWVHGGLTAAVLDYFCAQIARSALDMRVATGTLDLRYRQPVTLDGGPYAVVGTADRPGSKTVRVRAAINDDAGRPLTEANGLFVGIAPLESSRTEPIEEYR